MQPLFLINPHSSTVRKRGSTLEKIALEHDIALVKTRDVRELPEILRATFETGTDWICIEGGDGTVQSVMSAYMQIEQGLDHKPHFSLLPGGMTNQIARQIGMKRGVEKRLLSLLRGDAPDIIPMPMLEIETKGSDALFGFLFSTGALPMATRYYHEKLHKDGKAGTGAVTQMIAKGFAGRQSVKDDIYRASPLSLRVTGDKEEIYLDDDHLTTVVTTLPGLMLGLDPFWGDGSGALRLTYVRSDARHILKHLLSLWAGRKNVSRVEDGIESFAAHVLQYAYDGPVILDGENLRNPDGQLTLRATQPIEFWR